MEIVKNIDVTGRTRGRYELLFKRNPKHFTEENAHKRHKAHKRQINPNSQDDGKQIREI